MIYSEVMNKHNIRRTVRKSGKFIEKHTTKWLETMFLKSKYFLCRLSNPGTGNCFHSINQWNYTISFPIHLQIRTEYRLIPFAVGFISRFILFSSIMEENLGKVYIETLNRKHKLRVKQVQIADRTREKNQSLPATCWAMNIWWWCSFFTRLRKQWFRIHLILFPRHKQRKMLPVIKSNTTTMWHKSIKYSPWMAQCCTRIRKAAFGMCVRVCVFAVCTWLPHRFLSIDNTPTKPYRSAAARLLFKF